MHLLMYVHFYICTYGQALRGWTRFQPSTNHIWYLCVYVYKRECVSSNQYRVPCTLTMSNTLLYAYPYKHKHMHLHTRSACYIKSRMNNKICMCPRQHQHWQLTTTEKVSTINNESKNEGEGIKNTQSLWGHQLWHQTEHASHSGFDFSLPHMSKLYYYFCYKHVYT